MIGFRYHLCSNELVRQLQSLISSQLSPLVTRRLAGARLEGDDCHSTAALVTEEVLDSHQYETIFVHTDYDITCLVQVQANLSITHLKSQGDCEGIGLFSILFCY